MWDSLIPMQKKGNCLDVTAQVILADEIVAAQYFEQIKQRLLNVNNWGELCKLPASAFKLIDVENKPVNREAREKDFIRIDIPGPGSPTGEGFDWVCIEKIVEQEHLNQAVLSMTVRPTHHPLKPKNTTAHFFSSSATSTFQVKRDGNKISAEVHGRNELSNKTGSLFDKIRNTLVAFGAKMGFSYPQWKLLVEGLVSK